MNIYIYTPRAEWMAQLPLQNSDQYSAMYHPAEGVLSHLLDNFLFKFISLSCNLKEKIKEKKQSRWLNYPSPMLSFFPNFFPVRVDFASMIGISIQKKLSICLPVQETFHV